ncbi:protein STRICTOSIDINE SYNTHASE-LIKE 9-like isoform X2 [Ipomoea triloba]|uniref:protein STRICTOSIDINE SYNTHASE-LIKE 9-like isoform X2 n=1 Tax=Ipomoea triloba TaxID=35885 RepID=UPI00125E9873|nr:protein STRICTOSIDINE SYNTHASE-LIKE 9-like isoform X2 [Ipomoea triloba]
MKSLTMFRISILMFISSPCVIHSQLGIGLPIKLKLHAIGPEDVAFNGKGQGPYTGVADGRILEYYNDKFIDFATTSPFRNFTKVAQSGDTSGRLLKYEMNTGQVKVVLRRLSGPTGLAISKDKTFLVISEFIGRKITKHIIKGPKAGLTQTILKLEGQPDNVKWATSGGFWVAVNILKPPQPEQLIPMTESIAVKFDINGKILDKKNVTLGYPNSFSGYLEYFGKAYTGSLVPDFLGVYRLK